MSQNGAAHVAQGTPLRLLCVDDRSEDAELEQLSLSRAGYEVDAIRVDSEAALASALADCAFDVALLDFTLPGWDCRDALRQLLSSCPGTPVISVAGTIGEETAVELLKLGAADYVSKDHSRACPTRSGARWRRRPTTARASPPRRPCVRARRATGAWWRRRPRASWSSTRTSTSSSATSAWLPCSDTSRASWSASTPTICTWPRTWSSAASRRSAVAPASPRSTSDAIAGPTAVSSGSTSRRRRSSTTTGPSPGHCP